MQRLTIIILFLINLLYSPVYADQIWPTLKHDTSHTGQSAYFGPEANTLKWQFELPKGIINASPVIGTDGTIYIENNSSLFALNSDGSFKWKYVPNGGGISDCSPALSSDGTIYIPSASYSFYAINSNGTLKWQYRSDSSFNYSSPSIGTDGTIYVGSDVDLLAIKPDGNLLWKYRIGEEIASSPAIGSDGTIYVRGRYNYLCAIDKNGNLVWRLTLGVNGGLGVSSPSIGKDGTIYTPGNVEGSGLYAINPNGKIKWVYTDNELSDSNKSPSIDKEGTIYIAGTHKLVAINPNGSLKWVFEVQGSTGRNTWFSNSSPAIDSNGTIYIGTWGNYFYAINSNGTLKWQFETYNNIDSSPAIGPDGTIYFGSWDGYLYAIGPGQQAPANPGIHANGQNGTVSVLSNTPVSITVNLSPGDQNGNYADWWIVGNAPWGWLSFTLSGWATGVYPLITYPLFNLPTVELLNGYLPVGDYSFYFIVDMNPNGIFDAPFYYDGVQVHVIQ